MSALESKRQLSPIQINVPPCEIISAPDLELDIHMPLANLDIVRIRSQVSAQNKMTYTVTVNRSNQNDASRKIELQYIINRTLLNELVATKTIGEEILNSAGRINFRAEDDYGRFTTSLHELARANLAETLLKQIQKGANSGVIIGGSTDDDIRLVGDLQRLERSITEDLRRVASGENGHGLVRRLFQRLTAKDDNYISMLIRTLASRSLSNWESELVCPSLEPVIAEAVKNSSLSGFTKKNLYNLLGQEARESLDPSTKNALGIS